MRKILIELLSTGRAFLFRYRTIKLPKVPLVQPEPSPIYKVKRKCIGPNDSIFECEKKNSYEVQKSLAECPQPGYFADLCTSKRHVQPASQTIVRTCVSPQ